MDTFVLCYKGTYVIIMKIDSKKCWYGREANKGIEL